MFSIKMFSITWAVKFQLVKSCSGVINLFIITLGMNLLLQLVLIIGISKQSPKNFQRVQLQYMSSASAVYYCTRGRPTLQRVQLPVRCFREPERSLLRGFRLPNFQWKIVLENWELAWHTKDSTSKPHPSATTLTI